jgi:hypothetical protein
MYEKSAIEAEYLTSRQIDEVMPSSKTRARPKKKDAAEVEPKPDRQSSLSDRGGDAACPCIDLDGASLHAEPPDDTLRIAIGLSNPLPETGSIETSYEVYFDTDDLKSTGLTDGPLVGTDEILRIALNGHAPFTPPDGSVEVSLHHVDSGAFETIPPGEVVESRIVEDADSTAVSTSYPSGSVIEQPLAVSALGSMAASVPYRILATQFSGGVPIDTDTSRADLLRLRPLPGPNLTIDPIYAAPGEALTIRGDGFAPGVDLRILLDDDPVTTGHTDGTGGFLTVLTVPNLPQGFYFVTAEDTVGGGFDYSVLDIARGDLPVPVEGLIRFELKADPGSLVLSWTVGSGQEYTAFRIWRSEAGGEFLEAENGLVPAPPGGGPLTLMWRDERVRVGIEYEYRLEGVRHHGGTDPWSATVRGTPLPLLGDRLAMRIMGPSPLVAGQALDIELVVPAAGARVTVALFDVTGRRVAILFRGPLEGGTHVVNASPAELRRLSGGIYWVRAEAGPTVLTARVVMLE